MKIALVLVVGCFMVLTVSAASQYSTKYDNIDLDKILKSERLLKNYFNCLMDRGSCTADGKELKDTIPDALNNECARCNERQKNGARKVMLFLMKNKAEWWTELTGKYDPEGIHKDNYPTEENEKAADPPAETPA